VKGDVLRRSVAEFVGTFTLVFIGVSSIAVGGNLTTIAFAHGLAIAVMVSAVGHISGGHFNPAITFGFLITRRMAPLLALVYWVALFTAAIAGVLMVKVIFPDQGTDRVKLGAPEVASVIGSGAGFAMEAVLTFFLVFVVFATAADPRGTFKSIAGLAIGLTITMDILAGGAVTGAAMNPARAFGPELVQNAWTNAWVWYAGPLAGAAVAALAYEFLYLRPLAPAPVGPPETGLDEPRPGETALS
jgi:aquaporin TIP